MLTYAYTCVFYENQSDNELPYKGSLNAIAAFTIFGVTNNFYDEDN